MHSLLLKGTWKVEKTDDDELLVLEGVSKKRSCRMGHAALQQKVVVERLATEACARDRCRQN